MILYILIAVLMFGILIALHEFGHFAAAKLCGVRVNEFSIGMGPQILHKKRGETDYSFRLFPIGGFCAMEGEEEGESGDPRAFPNRPWPQRLIILLAGVFMNFLTGFVIILCLFSQAAAFYTPVVSTVREDAYAYNSGLRAGDRILAVNGHAVYLQQDVSFFLSRIAGDSVDLLVERDGVRYHSQDVKLTPYTDETTGDSRLMLGITLSETERATLGVKLKNAWFQSVDYIRMVWYSLGDLISGAVGLRDMSGPLGIIDMVGQVGAEGAQAAEAAGTSTVMGALVNIMNLVAFISINLSVMNLLPIPALDGGQILFMAVNGIYTGLTRKKLDPKYQSAVSTAGFICLMLLMAAVTVSDILKKFGV